MSGSGVTNEELRKCGESLSETPYRVVATEEELKNKLRATEQYNIMMSRMLTEQGKMFFETQINRLTLQNMVLENELEKSKKRIRELELQQQQQSDRTPKEEVMRHQQQQQQDGGKKRKKTEVDIASFIHQVNALPKNVTKGSYQGAPQHIAELQQTWSRIPENQKEGELQVLWDGKFNQWDVIKSNKRENRSGNEYYRGYDILVSKAAELELAREKLEKTYPLDTRRKKKN
jgi:hypothetical protein